MNKGLQFTIVSLGLVMFSLSTLLHLISFTEPIKIFNYVTPFILALFCASYGGYILNREKDIFKQKVKLMVECNNKSEHDTLAEIYNLTI